MRKTRSLKHLLLALLFLLFTGSVTHGAPADEAEAADQNRQEPARDEAAVEPEPEIPPPEEQGSRRPSADVFIPSEEISEDFAVAFPVDI